LPKFVQLVNVCVRAPVLLSSGRMIDECWIGLYVEGMGHGMIWGSVVVFTCQDLGKPRERAQLVSWMWLKPDIVHCDIVVVRHNRQAHWCICLICPWFWRFRQRTGWTVALTPFCKKPFPLLY
jgi:hypothetical protein